MRLSQSKALGKYPLARSQLTLGTRGKEKIEQRIGGRPVSTDQKSEPKIDLMSIFGDNTNTTLQIYYIY